MRIADRVAEAASPAATGAIGAREAVAMSEELKTVLRDVGAAGYRLGYQAELDRLAVDPFESANAFPPRDAGRDCGCDRLRAYRVCPPWRHAARNDGTGRSVRTPGFVPEALFSWAKRGHAVRPSGLHGVVSQPTTVTSRAP